MEHVADEDAAVTRDNRVSDPLRDGNRAALTAAPPDMNKITRNEKIAFAVAAIMTLAPLAAAAWGAYHPA